MPFWAKLIFVLGITWLSATHSYAATVAGTTIINQATLTYTDKATGQLIELKSNTSTILVAPSRQFELFSPNSINAIAGQNVTLSHSLRNIGNVDDRYLLSVENQLADNGDLINLMLYIDANNNGIVDPNETVVDSDVAVATGEKISLLITGVLPSELAGNDNVEVSLHAQAVESSLPVQSNTDSITITPSAKITLNLENSRSCDVISSPGDHIDLTLNALNQTQTLPLQRTIIVDGAEREGVLIEVILPTGLSLVAGEFLDIAAYQAIPVVTAGSNTIEWMGYEHWTGASTIDRLALLVPAESFVIEELVSMTFPVLVEETEASGKIFFNASIDLNFDREIDVESAATCINVDADDGADLGQAVATEIRFVEPAIELQRNAQTPSFFKDDDFIDAPVYRLAQLENDINQSNADYRLDLNGVYVELAAVIPIEQLVIDQAGVKYVLVSVASDLTGDNLQLLLRETASGTNLYRSIKPILLSPELSGDGMYCPGGSSGALPMTPDFNGDEDICTLRSDIDDTITVNYIDQVTGVEINDAAIVDPVSRVFDSTSLQGVADVIVSVVIDGQVQNNSITGLPLVFTTDEQGRYTLPRLQSAQNYSVQVQAPAEHVFPSSVEPEQFGSFVVTPASYGITGFSQTGDGVFSAQAGAAPPIIDIPLDPVNRSSLLVVEKSAESTSVDIGETLAYSIEVTNRSGGQLGELAVIDYPAFGFRYISGSATYDGVAIDNPQRLTVPANNADGVDLQDNQVVNGLRFQLSQVEPDSTSVLRYRMRATAGATDGSGINRAIANATTASGLVLSTPTSVAKVDIERSGVLSDQAIVFGKVYVDSSCDNIQNQGEWPIGGVRLYLQDGTFVVTDEDGQYSLYGLQPGLHVLKLDTLTMPEGLRLKPIDTRQAADPESRFVDLSAGDFQRADFASYCPEQHADVVFEELKQRNLYLRDASMLNEASLFDPDAAAPRLDVRKRADTDGDLSQGTLGFARTPSESRNPSRPTEKVVDDKANSVRSASELAQSRMGDPEELVKTITSEQATQGTWLWPQNDLSWDGRFIAVVRAGLDPVLYVNDQPVARTQIGEQIVNRRAGAQLVAWYGVQLVPGSNQVEVRAKDSFGNDRVLAQGRFRRPSAGVRLLLRTSQDTLEADGGSSSLPIDIIITDAHNNPAHGVYFVTLSSTGGVFEEDDLQLREPGMQVRVENGRGRVHLRSTELTGNVQIKARTGALDTSLNVVQIAAARPLIGAGLIDIGGQWNRADQGLDQRAGIRDGFEEDARVALFLKGRIKNDVHLSLSYDSDKNKDIDLLRDLNPNEHYATYGDSSLRGVEAQSRSKLFLKLEKDKNSIMWGDYLTDSYTNHDDLGRVQRTLTGINGVLDNGSTRFQAFAAEESASHRSEEIRGNGTAMLYQTERAPIVINSEVVERIVRDRDNPGLVIQSDSLQRYVDYSLDFDTGLLRFADVVPTVDSDLNPVFIRISYDLYTSADEYVVSGLRLLHEINPRLRVGASLTDDQNPTSGYTIGSVSATAQISINTELTATTAYQVHRADETDADAQRVYIEHAWHGRRDYRTLMTWARASRFFDNPAAGISQGREEWRLEHRQPISNTLKAQVEASHSRSLTESDRNTTASVNIEKTFSDWSVNAGARHVRSTDRSTDLIFNTFMLGARKRFTFNNGLRGSIGLDYEQDVKTSDRYRLGLSSRLQLHEHISVYARYELDQGLSFQSYEIDANRNHLFTAGIESDVLPSTKLYSEYRLRGIVDESNLETATGMRGRYEIEPKLIVSPALEFIDVRQGVNAEDSIAVSLGVTDNRNSNRKLSAQAEIRDTESSQYFGFRGAVAQRLNVDWTGLLREDFTRQRPDVGEHTTRHRLTVGFARRPKRSNKHHALYMADWKEDYGPRDGQDRTTYLLSTHQNRQISSNAYLSGRAGARRTDIDFESGSISSHVFMADLRGTFDIYRRWELDLRGGWLGTGGPGDGKYSFGFGLSWIAQRNLRLGLRYNLIGFREDDLDEQGYNAQGLRIGLQVKFDEDWFKWLE